MRKKSAETKSMDAAAISRFKKERFLMQLSEDEFRDKVVRPLFLHMGLRDGRDTCGREEEGKDALFVDTNKLGMREIWAVQTKRGNLNMASKASANTIAAITQLRTALSTKVTFLATKEKAHVDYAILCASGKVNATARKHICEEIDDPRLRFMDADDIIPKVDEHFPEYWWGIDADRFPYLRGLRKALLDSSDTISLSELEIDRNAGAPITDDVYVPLYLHRLTSKRIKKKGQFHTVPDMEQIPIHGVVGRRERLIHIVGEAGTGKTTALRRIAYTIANKAILETHVRDIPIVLKATDIAARDRRLLDLAAHTVLQYTNMSTPCFTKDDLDAGHLLLLVDALDEGGPGGPGVTS